MKAKSKYWYSRERGFVSFSSHILISIDSSSIFSIHYTPGMIFLFFDSSQFLSHFRQISFNFIIIIIIISWGFWVRFLWFERVFDLFEYAKIKNFRAGHISCYEFSVLWVWDWNCVRLCGTEMLKMLLMCVFVTLQFMGSQLVCNGCRNILVYPRGATNVCCALCNTVTSVPPPGTSLSLFFFNQDLRNFLAQCLVCWISFTVHTL